MTWGERAIMSVSYKNDQVVVSPIFMVAKLQNHDCYPKPG
jgi:hypothetical protein